MPACFRQNRRRSSLALKMGAAAIEKVPSAKDALPALLPIGLGPRGGEFDKVFMDTFQFIVLRGQNPRTVLDRETETLRLLMTETVRLLAA